MIKIYTLVYDDHLDDFNSNIKQDILVNITNLDREIKQPRCSIFHTVIYRSRTFKVVETVNSNRYSGSMKKLINLSKYLRKTPALKLNEINPYVMIRHCVKVKKFL